MLKTTAAWAAAILFALLPAVAAGGAMALPVLICLAGAASIRPSLLRQAVENKPPALLLLLAFLAWAVLSALWSPNPATPQSAKIAILIPLALAFAAAALANEDARRLTRAAGLAAFAVLACLIAFEALSGLLLNRLGDPDEPLGELVRKTNRGATVALSLSWGAIGGLLALGGAARAAGALLVFAAAGFVALQFDLLAHAIAFAAGLAAFAVAWLAPRLALIGAPSALALWMLAAPFVTPLLVSNQRLVDALPLSWAHRAGIWEYTCARILEQPWIGRGLDASRAVTDRIEVRDGDMRGIPLHPHSASLQIWYETGAVGAVLAAAFLVLGGLALARAFGGQRAAAAGACATVATLGLVANVSYGIWQEWWIATLFIAAAVVGAAWVRPQAGAS